MRSSPLVVALTGVVILAACGGSTRHRGSGGSTTAAPKSTCTPSIAAGTHTESINIGGRTRTVIVHVPPSTGTGARALVVDLHGSGSTAAQQEIFSGMDSVADSDGFVVAYPQAAIRNGSGFDWNIPGVPLIGGRAVPAGAADDIAFVKAVVAQLHTHACIDPTRVDATGMSGGGRLSSQLACDASTTFAAVAPVSGLRFPSPCPATRAVPVVAFHGTADPVDPYNGNGQPYWTYSVPTAAQRWGAHDRCSVRPTRTSATRAVVLTEYSSCRDGAIVDLYTIAGEGHEWPGGPVMPAVLTRVAGPQSNAINADAVMWRFFQAHPLRTGGD